MRELRTQFPTQVRAKDLGLSSVLGYQTMRELRTQFLGPELSKLGLGAVQFHCQYMKKAVLSSVQLLMG